MQDHSMALRRHRSAISLLQSLEERYVFDGMLFGRRVKRRKGCDVDIRTSCIGLIIAQVIRCGSCWINGSFKMNFQSLDACVPRAINMSCDALLLSWRTVPFSRILNTVISWVLSFLLQAVSHARPLLEHLVRVPTRRQQPQPYTTRLDLSYPCQVLYRTPKRRVLVQLFV